MRFEIYRKAIAVALAGLVGLGGQFVPGLTDLIPAEALQALSVLLATLVAWKVENRLDGQNVNDLAESLRDLLSDAFLDAAQEAGDTPSPTDTASAARARARRLALDVIEGAKP